MASEAQGKLLVPVWVDSGVVKALINDAGQMPVTEQTPLTDIQARLYGYDGETWLPLRTDEDKNIFAVIAGQEYDLAVGCSDADDLFTGGHGYNGTDWKKQGIIWAYHSGYLDNQTDVSGAAAHMTINLPAIDPGYVCNVFGVGVYRNTVIEKYASLQQVHNSNPYAIQEIDMPLAGWMYSNDRPMFLESGDNVRIIYRDCTNGETCITSVWGTLMKVNM